MPLPGACSQPPAAATPHPSPLSAATVLAPLLALSILAAPARAQSPEYMKLFDQCQTAMDARPEAMWCQNGASLTEVHAWKQCNSEGLGYCPRMPCVMADECVSHLVQSAEELRIHQEDQRRLCACLGFGFSIKTIDTIETCVHTETLEVPFISKFDIGHNERTYERATCSQLEKCMEIAIFDESRSWDDRRSATSCLPFIDCRENFYVSLWAECLQGDMHIRDTKNITCSYAQQKAICNPFRDTVYCHKCGGALADPGKAPLERVCAQSHGRCSNASAATPDDDAHAECYSKKGVYCPEIAALVNQSQPGAPPQHVLLNANEACHAKEVSAHRGELLCARKGGDGSYAAFPVLREKDCSGSTDVFCPRARCDVSPTCQHDFTNAAPALREQNFKDVSDLCLCLGEEWAIAQLQSGWFTCVHMADRLMWSNNKWDLAAETRTFMALTCEELARCEVKHAVDRVDHLRALPASCKNYSTCVETRELGEAMACQDETIVDKHGKTCTETERNLYCKAEMTAILCEECHENGVDGLDRTKKICSSTTPGNCIIVDTAEACINGKKTRFYCPTLFDPVVLTDQELCRACEKNQSAGGPKGFCCADVDHAEYHIFANAGSCVEPDHNTTQCAALTCEMSDECRATTNFAAATVAENAVASLACECLGSAFVYGNGKCVKQDSGQDYDKLDAGAPSFTGDNDAMDFTELTCEQVSRCVLFDHATMIHVRYASANCEAHKECMYARDRQRVDMCRGMGLYGSGTQCDGAQRSMFCGARLSSHRDPPKPEDEGSVPTAYILIAIFLGVVCLCGLAVYALFNNKNEEPGLEYNEADERGGTAYTPPPHNYPGYQHQRV